MEAAGNAAVHSCWITGDLDRIRRKAHASSEHTTESGNPSGQAPDGDRIIVPGHPGQRTGSPGPHRSSAAVAARSAAASASASVLSMNWSTAPASGRSRIRGLVMLARSASANRSPPSTW